jgi:hypothetical protein
VNLEDLSADGQEGRLAETLAEYRRMLDDMARVHPDMAARIGASALKAEIDADYSTQKPQSKRIAGLKRQVAEAEALIEEVSAFGETVLAAPQT